MPRSSLQRAAVSPCCRLLLVGFWMLLPAAGQASKLKTGLERLFGRQAASALRDQYGCCESPTLGRWVTRVGQRVVAPAPRHDLPWRFGILDTEEINALAIPGGHVFVTKGFLRAAHSEDEIAAVLAHEVGHVVESHSWEQTLVQSGALLLLRSLDDNVSHGVKTALAAGDALLALSQSRRDELQSDQWGIRLATEAGYDPEGMIGFLDTLRWLEGKPPSRWEVLLATHPPEHVRRAAVLISQYRRPHVPARGTLLLARQRLREALRWYGDQPLEAAKIRQRLSSLPAPAPLPGSLKTQWAQVSAEAATWREGTDQQRQALREGLRRAFAVRATVSPVQRAVWARLNPEDPAWLYAAWRIAFLAQKLDDTLMTCNRLYRDSREADQSLQRARNAAVAKGAVPHLAAAGEHYWGREATQALQTSVDAALVEGQTAATLARRAYRNLLGPLMGLLDPTRPTSQRLIRGRLTAVTSTLLHAELTTQEAWQCARRSSRHLESAAIRATLADLAATEICGRLTTRESLDLAAYELACSSQRLADQSPVTVAGKVAVLLPQLEAYAQRSPTVTQVAEVESLDPAPTRIILQCVQRAFSEESALAGD